MGVHEYSSYLKENVLLLGQHVPVSTCLVLGDSTLLLYDTMSNSCTTFVALDSNGDVVTLGSICFATAVVCGEGMNKHSHL